MAFERWSKRVEKLRASLDREIERWVGHLRYYSKELHPLEMEIGRERKEWVRQLYSSFGAADDGSPCRRAWLREIIRDQLSHLAETFGGQVEEDLRTIFEAIEGGGRSQAGSLDSDEPGEGKGEPRSGARGPGSAPAGDDSETAEFRWGGDDSRADRQDGTSGKARRPSQRFPQEPAAEELRKRDVCGLYRRLAKRLHPDLEQDSERRAEKESAMKELTTAYKNNDLRALRRLEVAWILRDDADAGRLTDEKLEVYNQVLKEQVAELRERLTSVQRDPRFRPLKRYTESSSGGFVFDGPAERRRLRAELKAVRSSVAALRGPSASDELRSILDAHAPRSPRLPDWMKV